MLTEKNHRPPEENSLSYVYIPNEKWMKILDDQDMHWILIHPIASSIHQCSCYLITIIILYNYIYIWYKTILTIYYIMFTMLFIDNVKKGNLILSNYIIYFQHTTHTHTYIYIYLSFIGNYQYISFVISTILNVNLCIPCNCSVRKRNSCACNGPQVVCRNLQIYRWKFQLYKSLQPTGSHIHACANPSIWTETRPCSVEWTEIT